jgi:hypothetical protein
VHGQVEFDFGHELKLKVRLHFFSTLKSLMYCLVEMTDTWLEVSLAFKTFYPTLMSEMTLMFDDGFIWLPYHQYTTKKLSSDTNVESH